MSTLSQAWSLLGTNGWKTHIWSLCKILHSNELWEFSSGPVVRTRHFHCSCPGSVPGLGTESLQVMQRGQTKQNKIKKTHTHKNKKRRRFKSYKWEVRFFSTSWSVRWLVCASVPQTFWLEKDAKESMMLSSPTDNLFYQ